MRISVVTNKLAEHLKSKKLSASELQIALLIFKGHTSAEIADIRCTTISPVKMHLTNIYKKLGVKNRIGIFNYCLEYIFPQFFKEHLETPEKFEILLKQLDLPTGLKW